LRGGMVVMSGQQDVGRGAGGGGGGGGGHGGGAGGIGGMTNLIVSGNYSVDDTGKEKFIEKDYGAEINQNNRAWRVANWLEHLVSPPCYARGPMMSKDVWRQVADLAIKSVVDLSPGLVKSAEPKIEAKPDAGSGPKLDKSGVSPGSKGGAPAGDSQGSASKVKSEEGAGADAERAPETESLSSAEAVMMLLAANPCCSADDVESTNGDAVKGVELLSSKYVEFLHLVAKEMEETGDGVCGRARRGAV
jgi:hypothetical protein